MESLILVAVLAVGALFFFVRKKRPNEVAMVGRHHFTPTQPLLEYLEAAHSCSSENDRRYLDAVAALKVDATVTARLIAAEFDKADRELKPSLVMAANATESDSMLPFLDRVAAAETPPGDIGHSRLRLGAIDGLEALAKAGNAEAIDRLAMLARSADRAVQACAVAALKFSAPDHLARIQTDLPASAREWLEVTRPQVHEVPQVSAVRRHLRRPEQPPVAKPGADREAVARDGRPSHRRSPRVHTER